MQLASSDSWLDASSQPSVALQASSITRSSLKTSSMRSVIRDLETREKGVDICILMDGTGSMVGSIYIPSLCMQMLQKNLTHLSVRDCTCLSVACT